MWACNAKKSGSGDQTYLRAENERGTAGDETTLARDSLVPSLTTLRLRTCSVVTGQAGDETKSAREYGWGRDYNVACIGRGLVPRLLV